MRPIIVVIFLTTIPASTAFAAIICEVNDPGGKQLNVRSGPNGDIIATMRNGIKVEFIEEKKAKGKTWTLISKFGAGTGYVFGDYIRCDGEDELGKICTVADPTGTSLNVRKTPAGAVSGTWENGLRVRPYEEKFVNGKNWVGVDRFAEDNKVGWVFGPYLQCKESND